MAGADQNARDEAAAETPQLSHSDGFVDWLLERNVGLAFTTLQGGMVFLIGVNAESSIAMVGRAFGPCYGVHAIGNSLFVATRFQIWRLENRLGAGETVADYDKLFIPQAAYTTGEVQAMDIAIERSGRVLFANPLFSCVAEVSDIYSFVPVWRPPFVSALAAEDRCHLNGLAIDAGVLRYATALAPENVAKGWRARRTDGGVLIDTGANEVISSGLSLPHAPRIYRDRLWLLESGSGHFGFVDRDDGRFEPVTLCPGFLRGLAFVDGFAIATISQPRQHADFEALPIAAALEKSNAQPQCALVVIDLESGNLIHWLRIDGVGGELGDVTIIENARQPGAVGLLGDPIRQIFSVGPVESALSRDAAIAMD